MRSSDSAQWARPLARALLPGRTSKVAVASPAAAPKRLGAAGAGDRVHGRSPRTLREAIKGGHDYPSGSVLGNTGRVAKTSGEAWQGQDDHRRDECACSRRRSSPALPFLCRRRQGLPPVPGLVKGFNHLPAGTLAADPKRQGAAGRGSCFLSSDDEGCRSAGGRPSLNNSVSHPSISGKLEEGGALVARRGTSAGGPLNLPGPVPRRRP